MNQFAIQVTRYSFITSLDDCFTISTYIAIIHKQIFEYKKGNLVYKKKKSNRSNI